MSYQEKRSVVTVTGGVIIFGVYFAMVVARLGGLAPELTQDAETMLRFWATAVLVYIPITVVLRIVLMIVFTIVYRIAAGEEPPSFDDERDKLIELKVTRVSQAIFGLGFITSMVPIVMGMSVTVMFVTIMISGVVAEVTGEVARILMYHRGV